MGDPAPARALKLHRPDPAVAPAEPEQVDERTRPLLPPVVAGRSSTPRPSGGAGIQRKVRVGSAADSCEVEAEATARIVADALAGQRISPEGSTGHAGHAHVARSTDTAAGTIGAEGGDLDSSTQQRLGAAMGSGGSALPTPARRAMELAFGADFGRVRVHGGDTARQLSDGMQAQAFTVNNHVFFRDGMPDVGTRSGQELLAHELTHVVQNRAAPSTDPGVHRLLGFGKKKPTKATPPPLPKRHKIDKSSVDFLNAGKGTHKAAEIGDHPGWESMEIDKTTESVSYGVTGTTDEQGLYDARTGKTNADANSDPTYDAQAKLGSELTLGGGSELAMFAGIASIADLIKKVKNEDGEERSPYDYATMGIQGASGLATVGSGATHLGAESDKIHNSIASSKADVGAAGLDAVMGSLSGLQATLDLIKQIYDLITNWAEKDKGEVSRDVAEMSGNLIKAAKSGVDTARSILTQWNQGNTAIQGLAHAAPGLGLGIQIAEIIVRAYDMAISWQAASGRRVDKREAKKLIGGKVGVSSKQAAEAIMADPSADAAKKTAAQEYLLQKGLQNINDKRFRRGLLKMGVAVTKASGEAATLGGASAPVGFSLKLAGFAIDAGATLLRNVKQWGRNKAEKAAEKRKSTPGADPNEKSIWEKIFDKDKSTKKKIAEYNHMVDGLFDRIVAAADEKDFLVKEKLGKQARAMVESTGMSWKEFETEGKKGVDALRAKLIEAMRQRG